MVCRALSNYALRRKLAFFATKLIFDPNHKKRQKIAQFYVPPLLNFRSTLSVESLAHANQYISSHNSATRQHTGNTASTTTNSSPDGYAAPVLDKMKRPDYTVGIETYLRIVSERK
jgi:hypothetical protein